ncbi:MAG: efflux RND transporter periplasmic adaptor subunit [candidate division Zixibacteria bacterium]|nr:efflux RND transporter periplasmic adaptor subunit [candidate division Zixibacteria bacterium]
MFKKIILITIAIIIIGAVIYFMVSGSGKKENGIKKVKVEKGAIIDKALAVGRIEPEREISVKSKISGLVKKIYVDIGDQVKVGDLLIDVAPDPTPIEFAEAKREVEIFQVGYDNAKREFDRVISLRDKQLVSNQEYEGKKATFDEAELRLKLAKEKLGLIQSGPTEIADLKVDNTIKSPIIGMVLAKLVEEGDPVVPLTSYQAGTDLMVLAYMEDLIFKGTVDEIDVGKLKVDMPVEIKVGAIPNDTISGYLYKISPRAHKEEGSTLFDIEIRLNTVGKSFLRAGYSANANIVITKKTDILLVPERLVKVGDSVSTVEVIDSVGAITTKKIKTGLSDGINIEVVDGLKEGEMIVERPPKEIK